MWSWELSHAGAIGLKDQSAPPNHGALGAIALDYAQCQWPGPVSKIWEGGIATFPKKPGNGWYFPLDLPTTTCLQLMATATFSDRESAEKAVKTLHLGSQEVRSHLWIQLCLKSFVSRPNWFCPWFIRTDFKAWRGQPNRNCSSVEHKHCALEGLEEAYVECAQQMSRIWKRLVVWTRHNMKNLPGFLVHQKDRKENNNKNYIDFWIS